MVYLNNKIIYKNIDIKINEKIGTWKWILIWQFLPWNASHFLDQYSHYFRNFIFNFIGEGASIVEESKSPSIKEVIYITFCNSELRDQIFKYCWHYRREIIICLRRLHHRRQRNGQILFLPRLGRGCRNWGSLKSITSIQPGRKKLIRAFVLKTIELRPLSITW